MRAVTTLGSWHQSVGGESVCVCVYLCVWRRDKAENELREALEAEQNEMGVYHNVFHHRLVLAVCQAPTHTTEPACQPVNQPTSPSTD